MLGRIGMPELIVIFLVFILLFGAKKLPELAKGLAQAIQTFRKEVREIQQDLDVNETAKTATITSAKKDTSNDYAPSTPKRNWRPKKEGSTDVEKV